ncbi:metal ABC transporter solute-binding protein, Zn/Mn family [Allofustis seminis]|uniref:metal ABC transporter solute-binding protein, Zn/Mn family n=1 Tax=Allofustis seminis TaxID=166939 RepID=UPI00037FE9A2|nr:zinc ABC transporter substrate-binding protein [Allofustis seminis]
MKKRLTHLFLAFAAIVLVACGKGTTSKSGDKLHITTSFYPMYEFTQKVAGDRADVSVLVSGGAGAHGYEPSAKDIAQLSEADIFIYSSDQMEFWAGSMLETVENDHLVVVKTSDKEDMLAEATHDHEDEGHDHDDHEEHHHDHEDEDEDHDHDDHEEHHHDHEDEDHDHDDHDHGEHDHHHDHGGVDPHNWLDPQEVIRQVDVIKEALIEADPEGKEVYEKNAEAFKKELEALDHEYEEAFHEAKARVFVVQHKAFGYLAHRYHLEQVAASGVNTEAEPTPQALAELNEVVKETQVPVIYYQSGANSKIAETISAETGTKIAVLYDLERAPKDVEGAKDDMSYVEAMRFNLEQLKKSIK